MGKTKKRILSIFLAVMTATTMLVALPAKALAVGEVCEIVETGVQYMTLDDALMAYTSGETIKFLDDITETTSVYVYGGDELTIDLDGYNWDLNGTSFGADGGTLTVKNGGTITTDAIEACYDGTVTIEGGTVIVSFVDAYEDGTLTIECDTVTVGYNIQAWTDGTIAIECDTVTASYIAAWDGATLSITADINIDDSLYAGGDGTTITVVGNINSTNTGVYAEDDATITVTGNIDAVNWAAFASYGATITVTGDVSIIYTDPDEAYVVVTWNGGNVIINGNVTGTGGSLVTGVYCEYNSQATINGTIDAPRYISLGWWDDEFGNPYEMILTAEDFITPSSRDGYLEYSISYELQGIEYFDVVWVVSIQPNLPLPVDPTLPGTGDTRTLILGSFILLLALMGAGALVLSRRKAQQS